MNSENFRMNEVQNTLNKVLIESQKGSGEDLEEMDKAIEGASREAAQYLFLRIKEEMFETLSENREIEKEFCQNNYERWSKGIDLIETFIGFCQQIGEAINSEYRENAVKNNDFRFEAIISLHARALLVSREILWLLKGGFADGALGRWRTLHEIAVVATFLSEQDISTSERYLIHRNAQNYKALKQYEEYQEQAHLTPLEEYELQDAKHAYDKILSQYGDEMRHDWGWAALALENKKPNFRQIEESVKLDHWRPRYKWSSQDTHGSYRPHNVMLGTSESSGPVLLAGPSNSGLTDPAQMMSTSLYLVTDILALGSPNIDGRIYSEVLEMFVDEVSSAFLDVHNEAVKNQI